MFTFLHAADLHLDSPLCGLDKYDGAPVNEIRAATRRALENLVALAIQENVSFLVISGDLYDGDWRDFNTGLFFVQQMARLKEAGIPVYGVTGNHDAANKMTRRLPLPGNVRFFASKKPESALVEELDVAIHGQSFAEQCTSTDLAKEYPAPVPGCFNIGVLHTSMTGREGHASYAPCSEDCLRSKGYDYWALGHVHQREVLAGSTTIAYPGNIQGRHIRESGPKGCLMVRVDGGTVHAEFVPLDVLRWQRVEVDLALPEQREEIFERAAESLRGIVERGDGRLIAVRVILVGETTLAGRTAGDLAQLTADLRAVAVDVGAGNLWLEKVINATRDSAAKLSASTPDDGPLAEVASLVGELLASPMVATELGVDFSDLQRKLPGELADAVQTADATWWREVLHEAKSRLVAQIRSEACDWKS
jgi:DNA repair exonuclease SbcCD nuclease subunit